MEHIMESVTLSLFVCAREVLFIHSSNERKANFLVGINVLVSSQRLETENPFDYFPVVLKTD